MAPRNPPAPLRRLLHRELGDGSATALESALLLERCQRLRLSRHRRIHAAHGGGITWLDLDPAEQRYLLAGAADATLAAYDTHALDDVAALMSARDAGGSPARDVHGLAPVFVVPRNHPGAHQFMVSCVAWYPGDTGLFVSSGHDYRLKLWDTNSLQVVASWQLAAAQVTCCGMSRFVGGPTAHLVAAGGLDPWLRLCDMRTATCTHTLVGHRQAVSCLAWSLRSEHELVSGDRHGQVLVWDVRRFGALRVLDQYDTRRVAATAPGAAPSALQRLPPATALLQPVAQAQQPVHAAERGAASAGGDAAAVRAAWSTMDAALRSDVASSQQQRGRRGHGADAGRSRAQHPGQETPLVRDLPLSASAPGLRPGRTGDAIGGRAPSGAAGAGEGLEARTSPSAAYAHQGAVTAVLPTPDGLCWLTAGTDSRLRRWDGLRWQRRVTGYAGTHNSALRGRQLAATQDGRLVFHPSGSVVQVFDVHSSRQVAELAQGHTESINAMAWNPLLGELYSGANDSAILVWAPSSSGEARGGRRGGGGDDGSDGDDGGGYGRGQGSNQRPHTDSDDSSSRGGPGLSKRKAKDGSAGGSRAAVPSKKGNAERKPRAP